MLHVLHKSPGLNPDIREILRSPDATAVADVALKLCAVPGGYLPVAELATGTPEEARQATTNGARSLDWRLMPPSGLLPLRISNLPFGIQYHPQSTSQGDIIVEDLTSYYVVLNDGLRRLPDGIEPLKLASGARRWDPLDESGCRRSLTMEEQQAVIRAVKTRISENRAYSVDAAVEELSARKCSEWCAGVLAEAALREALAEHPALLRLQEVPLACCLAELHARHFHPPAPEALRGLIEQDIVFSERLEHYYGGEPGAASGLDTAERGELLDIVGQHFAGGPWPCNMAPEQEADAFFRRLVASMRAAGWTVGNLPEPDTAKTL